MCIRDRVYTELNIGVGRPTASQLNAIPHHLIGHISIHQDYSVAHYTNEALHILDELFLHHDMVILCLLYTSIVETMYKSDEPLNN